MKGLFKRLSILTASLAMVFGVGLVNNEKNTKAAGESIYVKVTEAPTDWTGEYVLVYESSATSAYVWTGVDASSCYERTTITDSKITLAPTAKLNIASMTGGYSIKIIGGTNDGKYIGGIKNKNTINFSNSSILNTIAYSSSAVAITSNSTTMKYNSAIGQERFRYYKSGQSAVQLYKLDESSIDPNESKITLDLSSSMMKVEATLTLNAETSGTGTTITWESSDINVATVADGVVTALKAGTTTITATFGTASASCKILVNDHSGTSVDDPLTVAEARNAIDAGFTSEVYVKGIITAKSFNSTYKNYTVTVVDDTADTTNVFKFYRMKDIDGADFTSDTLVVGETIIARGSLIKYGSDYELNEGCHLVKKIEKEISIIVVSGIANGDVYYVGDSIEAKAITVTAMYEDDTKAEITDYTIDPELPYALTSSDVGSKTFTITYKGLTEIFTITVKEKPTDLVLSEIKITEGENVKKTYYVGDSVDTTGLTVTAGYLSASDPSHESYVDVTDKVTWSLDTSAINAEAHLTATYVEGEITETTYIIVAVVAAPTYVVDKLTAADLAAENNTYTDFRDVTATSGIKYAGNSAKDSSTYIQLRSNKDKNTGSYSGIVSTTANRILTKVEVEWASKTADARTIDVYGYNVAFNDASDLYNTKAEKLGTLKKTDTSLEIPTNTKYAYVGIRSTSGAIYLASISFTWDISSEANSFIDMWSQMRANGTNGICDYLNGSQDSSELDTLLEMYNDSSLIDAADKAIINDAADGENNTIGNSILYIAAYKAAHTSNNAGMNNAYHAVTNNISFILIISVIGLSSVLGYYFIQKRRLAK